MDVILLEKVENLGNLGDRVSVKPGFGRNFLIPNGKAQPATADNVAAFEARRAELEKIATEALALAESRKLAIDELGTVSISHKAGEEGRLFGSVGTAEIAEAITSAGASVARNEVRLPTGALRHTGEYGIEIHLHTDVNATVTIAIVPED